MYHVIQLPDESARVVDDTGKVLLVFSKSELEDWVYSHTIAAVLSLLGAGHAVKIESDAIQKHFKEIGRGMSNTSEKLRHIFDILERQEKDETPDLFNTHLDGGA